MKTRGEDARPILRRGYIGDDPAREAAVKEEQIKAEITQLIYVAEPPWDSHSSSWQT